MLGVKLGGYYSIKCTAHTIQLAIREPLNKNEIIANIIIKCQQMVKYFEKSGPVMNLLVKAQNQLGIRELKLLQNVKTRWNSDFFHD